MILLIQSFMFKKSRYLRMKSMAFSLLLFRALNTFSAYSRIHAKHESNLAEISDRGLEDLAKPRREGHSIE